jgi:hypothetical protein
MQFCDIALFSALKGTWKQAVRDYQISNVGEFVTRVKFAKVFKSAWESACPVDISVKGFRDSGLFPFDPTKVLDTLKMEPSRVFRKEQSENVKDINMSTLVLSSAGLSTDTVTISSSTSTSQSDLTPADVSESNAKSSIPASSSAMNLLNTDAPNIQTLTVNSTIQESTIVTTPSSEPVTNSPKETPVLAPATNATSNMSFISTVPSAVAITPQQTIRRFSW